MMSKLIIVPLVLMAMRARAQQPPAVRQIGKLERVSADSIVLQSVQNALAMPNGRVMINDVIGRRVLLLDSTLAQATAVADTTNATGTAYGRSSATVIQFRGDSALLIVPSTLSMFVLTPSGAIARTMAVGRPSDLSQPDGSWIAPAVDAKGRLIYLGSANVLPGMTTIALGAQLHEDGKPTAATVAMQRIMRPTDSAAIVRADLETRSLDTLAWIKVPRFRRQLRADADGRAAAIESIPDALPILDLATTLNDGTLAIVRGRDLHIDWVDASGRITSSPKIPFDWKKVDDARKRELIDSTVKKWQAQYDQFAPRGGRGGVQLAPQVVVAAAPADLPGYVPPFGEHAVDSDAEGNVWIQTTTIDDDRPVYDVVNRRGELIDRVQLPAFRTIAGFGAGVVYMALQTTDRKVRLERARIH
ncbi:MAG TPA: hypothetical protein VGM50_15485 [Gemmatimonadaceae bacterium]|jgi:hypothetical protein